VRNEPDRDGPTLICKHMTIFDYFAACFQASLA